jgi:hypothetical protein
LIPGENRFSADRAIAGVVSGAGAVQAGAIEMLTSRRSASSGAASIALTINVFALLYALEHRSLSV